MAGLRPSIKQLALELLNRFEIHNPTPDQIAKGVSFVTDVIMDNKFQPNSILAHRESICLYWAAQGKSAQETADIMCLSKSTIETYRTRIKKKLNSTNMTQAVFQGMKQLMINPAAKTQRFESSKS